MKQITIKKFGNVTACEFGWSPVGRPLMTVHLYVVDSICIDTAFSHLETDVLAFLDQFPIDRVILTHHHEDHSGNAARLKERNRIPILGHQLTAAKLRKSYRILPYQHLLWGATRPVEVDIIEDPVETENLRLKPIHTPGHCKDHIVLYDAENGRLFSGDLFLGERIKYFRADEKIDEQMDSLKKVIKLDFDALFCSHNPHEHNGKQLMINKLEFFENVVGAIREAWLKGKSAAEIMHDLELKESWGIKLFCMGNVSMKNLVRSAIRSFQARPETVNS